MVRTLFIALLFSAGCARADIYRPIDTSLGVPLGLFTQDNNYLSTLDLADDLGKETETESQVDLFWGFYYPSAVIGAGAVGTWIATLAQDEAHQDRQRILSITAGSLAIGALACQVAARIFLSIAVETNNEKLKSARAQ